MIFFLNGIRVTSMLTSLVISKLNEQTTSSLLSIIESVVASVAENIINIILPPRSEMFCTLFCSFQLWPTWHLKKFARLVRKAKVYRVIYGMDSQDIGIKTLH